MTRIRRSNFGGKAFKWMAILPIVLHYAITRAAPIPENAKKSVAFVCVETPRTGFSAIGTGFFVSMSVDGHPDKAFIYFVTAKHVLTLGEGGPFRSNIFIRTNLVNGGTSLFPVPLLDSGPNRTIYWSSDETVDIAVIPLILNTNNVDFAHIPFALVTSREDFVNLRVSEGTEIFFTGLFVPYVGEKRNYPVVRFGRVALLTSEKVSWNGVPTDLYLVESSSYGGNSGSPVFLNLGVERIPGSLVVGAPDVRLAGVMKGAFQDLKPLQPVNTALVPFSTSNMGIAAVVPAYHLREILLSHDLQRLRTAVLEKLTQQHTSKHQTDIHVAVEGASLDHATVTPRSKTEAGRLELGNN